MEVNKTSNICLGPGWYTPESDGRVDFRWSSALSEILIANNGNDSLVLYAGTNVEGRRILFFSGSRLIAQLHSANGWNYYCVPLVSAERVTIVMETFQLVEKDARPLGLMVSEIFTDSINLTDAQILGSYSRKKPKFESNNYPKEVLDYSRKQMEVRCLDQVLYESDYFRLPDSSGRFFLNPTVFIQQNHLYLLTRESELSRPHEITGQLALKSSLRLFEIANTCEVIREVPFSVRLVDTREQLEDPRAIMHQQKLYVSCCSYLFGHTQYRHQKLLIFNQAFQHTATVDPVFRNNGPGVLSNKGDEKNWTWFVNEENLYCVYSMQPHVVVVFDRHGQQREEFVSHQLISKYWKFGEPRMGSNPMLKDGYYYNFFHSSLPWKDGKRQYFMGCYVFEAKKPFRIVAVSPLPILSGSTADPRDQDGPLVVFPGGSLDIENKWLVVFGVNDERCAWIKVPHQDLLDSLDFSIGTENYLSLLEAPAFTTSTAIPKIISVGNPNKNKILHHHIRKTGGTTFNQVLSTHFEPEKTALFDVSEANSINFADYQLIAHHGYLLDRVPDDWFVITFIRDPIQRVVSLYNDWRSLEEADLIGNEDDCDEKRKTWTMDIGSYLSQRCHHSMVNRYFVNGICKSLVGQERLSSLGGDNITDEILFNTAKEVIETKIDYIGTLECFNHCVREIQQRFGWDSEQELLHLNSSVSKIDKIEKLGRGQADYTTDCLLDYNHVDYRLYEFILNRS